MAGIDLDARGPAWMVQAAAIARRFYSEDRSKSEIATEFGLSRFKVARILDEARAIGLVEIHINLPTQIDADLSARLASHFGIRRAVVVAGSRGLADSGSADKQVCEVAADLLSELVTAEDVVGLTCSRNVTATIDCLKRLAPVPVVQLTGTLAGAEVGPGSVESVRQAAQVGRGTAYPIYAPMVLPDAATTRSLSNQASIRSVLDRFVDVTVAMVSIGAWAEGASSVWQTLEEPELRESARLQGAVGEIGARLFNSEGRPVDTPIDERVLGVTLEQLRGVREVVALALGRRRVAAIRAAIAGGVVKTLVCDADLAEALLNET